MAPNPRRAPKSKMARRPRRGRKTGKAATNTKVQLHAVYKQEFPWILQGTTGVAPRGSYNYTSYSPFNLSTQNVTQSAEFQAQKLLYDEFCITKVKVSWLPNINVASAVNTIPAGGGTNVTMFTAIDRDGQVPINAAVNIPQKLEAYDSFKRHSCLRPFSRVMTCGNYWLDCNTAALDPRSTDGYTQTYTNNGLFQLLVLYAENMALSSGIQLGNVRIEYTCKFRGKKPVSYTVLPDGVSVVMTPVEAFTGDEIVASNPPVSVQEVLYENEIVCDEVSGEIYVRSNWNGSRVPPVIV